MVICLKRGADLHMAQLMQVGFTFLVPAHLGSPGKGPLNGCVCVYVVRSTYNGDVQCAKISQLSLIDLRDKIVL